MNFLKLQRIIFPAMSRSQNFHSRHLHTRDVHNREHINNGGNRRLLHHNLIELPNQTREKGVEGEITLIATLPFFREIK